MSNIKNNPTIGITTSLDKEQLFLRKNYIECIQKAGGTAILLTPKSNIAYILSIIDGLLLSGGDDIHPKYFGQELHPKATLVPAERDNFEIELCNNAIKSNIPILGICRGMQVLNVACRGNLQQHIEGHMQSQERTSAPFRIEINNMLSGILNKKSLMINSLHHQAVGALGCNLCVDAYAADGIIEAIHHTKKHFVLGLQWHPEDLANTDPTQQKIFDKFINAAVV